jgi:hypothetical protein
VFFAPDGERPPERDVRERKAKAICAQCDVRPECLDYALTRPEKYGLWGGLNDDERGRERRRRMRKAAGDTPDLDPKDKRDREMYTASSALMRAGHTLESAAALLGVSRNVLIRARRRGKNPAEAV